MILAVQPMAMQIACFLAVIRLSTATTSSIMRNTELGVSWSRTHATMLL